MTERRCENCEWCHPMTDEQIWDLAAKMRASLRKQGLLPAYTDAPKGKFYQPPLLEAMLEKAIREHVVPLMGTSKWQP